MRILRPILVALVLVTTVFASACAHAQTPAASSTSAEAKSEGEYRIEKVRGDLYRFTAGHYHSVFLVTDDGIVVTDPISTAAAKWLDAQLAERFDAPVRYVIYSHSHPDHTYGGEVFAEPGVTFMAHRMAREALERTRAQTHLPNLTFDDAMTLRIGGQVIRLTYHGPNNGRGSVSMHFETERVMHVVDWIVLGRLPYKDLPGYDIHGMIDSTREILERDFDVFVGGHAEMGDKSDIRRYLAYLEALHKHVLDGMRVGKSLAEIKDEADFSEYSDLKMYDQWLGLNIEGVYAQLRDDSYMFMRPDVPTPDGE